MNRRQFISSISAISLAGLLPTHKAEAFVGCLLRAMARSAGGRHMLRFQRAGSRVRYAGRSGYRDRYIGNNSYEIRRRKKAKEILVESRNVRLFNEIGELVLDNAGNGFPASLNGNITACSGGYKDEIYCGTFPPTLGDGKPVIMEIAELQMLDEVGNNLPLLYRKDFSSDDETLSNKEILSYIHPTAHIKDGEFDDEWNHISPLVYQTARGRVIMKVMENSGKCIIEPKDSRDAYVIPLRWGKVDIVTGARV